MLLCNPPLGRVTGHPGASGDQNAIPNTVHWFLSLPHQVTDHDLTPNPVPCKLPACIVADRTVRSARPVRTDTQRADHNGSVRRDGIRLWRSTPGFRELPC